jgi:hypothetical protein
VKIKNILNFSGVKKSKNNVKGIIARFVDSLEGDYLMPV